MNNELFPMTIEYSRRQYLELRKQIIFFTATQQMLFSHAKPIQTFAAFPEICKNKVDHDVLLSSIWFSATLGIFEYTLRYILWVYFGVYTFKYSYEHHLWKWPEPEWKTFKSKSIFMKQIMIIPSKLWVYSQDHFCIRSPRYFMRICENICIF